MSKNLSVVLNKSDEGSFGFSLLGKFSGIPHVIYDVIEDSPAAECRVSNQNMKWKVVKKIQETEHSGRRKISYSLGPSTMACFYGLSDQLVAMATSSVRRRKGRCPLCSKQMRVVQLSGVVEVEWRIFHFTTAHTRRHRSVIVVFVSLLFSYMPPLAHCTYWVSHTLWNKRDFSHSIRFWSSFVKLCRVFPLLHFPMSQPRWCSTRWGEKKF